MSDSREMVPRNELVRVGGKGVAGIAGGIGLLVLRGIASATVPGLVVGGIITAVGLGISAASKKDRLAGLVATGAGALTVVASLPLIGGLGSGLMLAGGVGLLVAGGIGLYKFFKGLRTRR